MEFFLVFVFWVVLSLLVGEWAARKGRSAAGYFLLSLLLSPLIGLVAVGIVEPRLAELAKSGKLKQCPECAEYIQPTAKKCRFCGASFAPPEEAAKTTPALLELPLKERAGPPPAWRVVVGIVIVLLTVIGGISLDQSRKRQRRASNETLAIASLRTLHSAAEVYRINHGQYPNSLADLGPDGEGLIDSYLARGVKFDYVVRYKPVKNRRGRIIDFDLTAAPGEWGSDGFRSFYCDQTGVIRVTPLNKQPTTTDPPIF